MMARDIMTEDVITINVNAEIYELTKLLAERKVSGLPVLDDMGQVVGIVSEADLIALKNGSRVGDIMSREVISVRTDTPVEKVAAILDENKINRVPVYANDRIVGIISRADIVAAMASLSATLV